MVKVPSALPPSQTIVNQEQEAVMQRSAPDSGMRRAGLCILFLAAAERAYVVDVYHFGGAPLSGLGGAVFQSARVQNGVKLCA